MKNTNNRSLVTRKTNFKVKSGMIEFYYHFQIPLFLKYLFIFTYKYNSETKTKLVFVKNI